MARKGRGWLSSIDLLPEEAQPAMAQAIHALTERKKTQLEILDELNAELALLDPPQGPISRSAFNRHSLVKAAAAQKLAQMTAAARAMAEVTKDREPGEILTAARELTASMILDTLLMQTVEGREPSPAEIRTMSEAQERLAKTARHVAALDEDHRRRVTGTVGKALDTAVAAGRIDPAAAQRAREAMGFV
jgi:hypothetical protein